MTPEELQSQLNTLTQTHGLKKQECSELLACFRGISNAQEREAKQNRIVRVIGYINENRDTPVDAAPFIELLVRTFPLAEPKPEPPKPVIPKVEKQRKLTRTKRRKQYKWDSTKRHSKIEQVWHSFFPTLESPPTFYFSDWKKRWSEHQIFSAIGAAARSLQQKGEPVTAESAAQYVWGVLKKKPQAGAGQPHTSSQDVIEI